MIRFDGDLIWINTNLIWIYNDVVWIIAGMMWIKLCDVDCQTDMIKLRVTL